MIRSDVTAESNYDPSALYIGRVVRWLDLTAILYCYGGTYFTVITTYYGVPGIMFTYGGIPWYVCRVQMVLPNIVPRNSSWVAK